MTYAPHPTGCQKQAGDSRMGRDVRPTDEPSASYLHEASSPHVPRLRSEMIRQYRVCGLYCIVWMDRTVVLELPCTYSPVCVSSNCTRDFVGLGRVETLRF